MTRWLIKLEGIMDDEKVLTQDLNSSHNMKIDSQPLWTVDDVAAYLRIKPETVRKMARDGRLPSVRVGRSWRFLKLQIQEQINKSII